MEILHWRITTAAGSNWFIWNESFTNSISSGDKDAFHLDAFRCISVRSDSFRFRSISIRSDAFQFVFRSISIGCLLKVSTGSTGSHDFRWLLAWWLLFRGSRRFLLAQVTFKGFDLSRPAKKTFRVGTSAIGCRLNWKVFLIKNLLIPTVPFVSMSTHCTHLVLTRYPTHSFGTHSIPIALIRRSSHSLSTASHSAPISLDRLQRIGPAERFNEFHPLDGIQRIRVAMLDFRFNAILIRNRLLVN